MKPLIVLTAIVFLFVCTFGWRTELNSLALQKMRQDDLRYESMVFKAELIAGGVESETAGILAAQLLESEMR